MTEIPVTAVAVLPAETNPWIVLENILSLPAPVVIPVIVPVLLMLLIVLFFVALLPLVIFTFMAVMLPVPVPAVQLLNVFPSRVFVTLPIPASVLIQPEIVAVPLMVMLEKLLLLLFTVTFGISVDVLLLNIVMSPLAATRVKVPEILLPLMFCTPLAGIRTLLEIKTIAPVVFTLKLVKVLLLIFCDNVAAVLLI